MSLADDIRKDMFAAKKESNEDKESILQMALAELKNERIQKGDELTDVEEVKILRKEAKKLEEAAIEYEKMGRKELVEKEKQQLEYIQKYLPQLMSSDDIKKVVQSKIKELNAESMRDMGRVMGEVMKELEGKADGSEVNKIVKEELSPASA